MRRMTRPTIRKAAVTAAFAIGFAGLGFALSQHLEERRKPALHPAPTGPVPEYTRQAVFPPPRPIDEVLVLMPPDPGSLAEVLSDDDPFRRAARLGALLADLDARELPAVREALADSERLSGVERTLLVRYWARHDPRAATMWAATKSLLGDRSATVSAAIDEWARIDASGAAKTVQLLSKLPGQDLSDAERTLVRVWFETDQPGLETYIRDLGLTVGRQRALRTFFLTAVRRDGPEAAARWAETIPDDEKKFKIGAFRQLGAVLTHLDPAIGVAWCEAHCEGPFGGALRMLVTQTWAATDGPAAMAWVSQAPPGQERDVAVKGAVRGWAYRDLEEFHAWLDEMGVEGIEPWLQPALPGIAATLLPTRPEQAMRWAAAIDDATTREESLVGLAREWRRQDERAAREWIEASSLSDAARAQALAPLPRQGQEAPVGGQAEGVDDASVNAG
jgi:hypothetical protein